MRSNEQFQLNTKRVSWLGFEFDIESNIWRLGQDCKFHYDLSKIRSLLPPQTFIEVRTALSKHAENKPLQTNTINSLNLFAEFATEGFTEQAAAAFVAQIKTHKTDCYVSFIRTFLRYLDVLYPNKYRSTLRYLDKVKLRSKTNKFLDPEKGAFSETEEQLINVAIDNEIRDCKLNNANFRRWRKAIAFRLINCTHRRNQSIRDLKWADLRGIKHPLIDCFTLRIPRAKTQDTEPFRASFEVIETPLLDQVYSELCDYRTRYFNLLEARFSENGCELSHQEKQALYPMLPVIPALSLFETPWSSVDRFKKSLQDNPEAYHIDVSNFNNLVKDLWKAFDLKSMRTPNFRYGCKRQRHTLGTKAGMQGKGKPVIADLLGHTTLKAQESYIDMTPEMMRTINVSMGELENLKLAFEGKLRLAEMHSEHLIETFDEDQVKSIGEGSRECERCSYERPYACYPCKNFVPFATANHELIWQEYKHRYDNRIENGATERILAPMRHVLKYIAATIKASNNKMKQLGAG